MKKLNVFFSVLALAILMVTCTKVKTPASNYVVEENVTELNQSNVPDYMNTGQPVMAESNVQIHLGRMLFYDRRLSSAKTVACASCHKPQNGFADNAAFSTGVSGKKTHRNSMPILSTSGQMFWDMRAFTSIDLLAPGSNHLEMGFETNEAFINNIKNIEFYENAFSKYLHTSVNEEDVRNAVISFIDNFTLKGEKELEDKVQNQNFDGNKGRIAIGKNLFNSHNCASCHTTANPKSWQSTGNIGLDYNYTDGGIGDLNKLPEQNGWFKAPLLINLKFTAPYMHDGRFSTLRQVVEHYNNGIKAHKSLSGLLQVNFPQKNFFPNPNFPNGWSSGGAVPTGGTTQGGTDFLAPARMGMSEYELQCLVEFLESNHYQKTLMSPLVQNPFVN